jgi:hypothetical protein
MFRGTVTVLFVLLACGASAQGDSVRIRRIGVSYFSEGGWYPGFALNYERQLMANHSFQLLLAGKAGAYFHSQNHTGVFLMVQSGARFRVFKQLYFEHFLGIGYLHSFLNGGDAYYVNASGQIQKAYDTGNPHFMPSVSFGLSYEDKGKLPAIYFLRPMLFWQIPFNQVSLMQYAVEAGVLIKLKR